MRGARTIPGDWHPGAIPDNVVLDETALIETSYSFLGYRSEAPVGLRLGRGAGIYTGTMLDVGPRGQVRLGTCALVTAVQIVCDDEIEIGDHALLSWNVILMDSYRVPFDPMGRRRALEQAAGGRRQATGGSGQAAGGSEQNDALPTVDRRLPSGLPPAACRPIRIGNNVWIGFDACVLPGVTIGDGSIVGARSVVVEDVAPYTIVAGNPARVIRRLDEGAAHDG